MPPRDYSKQKEDSLRSLYGQKGFLLWALHNVFFEVIVVLKKIRKRSIFAVEDVDIYLIRYKETSESTFYMELCRDKLDGFVQQDIQKVDEHTWNQKEKRELYNVRRLIKKRKNEQITNYLCQLFEKMGIILTSKRKMSKRDNFQATTVVAYLNGKEIHEREELEYIGTEYLECYAPSQFLAIQNIMIHSRCYGADVYTKYVTDDTLHEWISQGSNKTNPS